ncbi:MAG: hypothetical protein R3F35_11020 [Myxococcota bacterium]
MKTYTRMRIWTRLRLDGVLLILRRRRSGRGPEIERERQQDARDVSEDAAARARFGEPGQRVEVGDERAGRREEAASGGREEPTASGISNRPIERERARQARVPPSGTRRGETVPALPLRPERHAAPRDPSRRAHSDPALEEAERAADRHRRPQRDDDDAAQRSARRSSTRRSR